MTIIFLNGTGSAGKTSIAKAISEISDLAWLTLGIDSFIDMMPDKYLAGGKLAIQGFQFIKDFIGNKPVINIKTGDFGKKVVDVIPKVVNLLADNDFHIIIDEVLFSDDEMKNYVLTLNKHSVYFVKIFCPLDELEKREIARGDRQIGLSRGQFDLVHDGVREYDIILDTSKISTQECAIKILEFISNNPLSLGFKKMEKLWK